jgi:subtilase-type serine protease
MVRTRVATRWIAIGGLAGVGVFAGLAAVSTHHASAKPDPAPAVDQPDTTPDPAATDAPVATAPAATSPAVTTPVTTPATTPETAPAPTPRVTTPRVTTPATTPRTLAPAAQTPVQVPSRRHAAVSGGS